MAGGGGPAALCQHWSNVRPTSSASPAWTAPAVHKPLRPEAPGSRHRWKKRRAPTSSTCRPRRPRSRARTSCWPVVIRAGRWVGELNFRHFKTGEAIPFLVDWFRIDDPRTGRPMNIATVSRDLTAQKRAEAELRHLNDTLERRVAERTAELAETSNKLVSEMRERERANARLQELQFELVPCRAPERGRADGRRSGARAQPAPDRGRQLRQRGAPAAREDRAPDRSARCGRSWMRRRGRCCAPGRSSGGCATSSPGARREKQIETSDDGRGSERSRVGRVARALGVEVHFRFDPNATGVRRSDSDPAGSRQPDAQRARGDGEKQAPRAPVTTALLDEETVEIAVADTGPGLARTSSTTCSSRSFRPSATAWARPLDLPFDRRGTRRQASERAESGRRTIFRFTLAATTMNGRNHAG